MKTNLKSIRKARGFKNAKDFADSIGMQEKTYRNYENDSRNIKLDVACRLCTALECSLEDLVSEPKEEYARVKQSGMEIKANELSDNEKRIIRAYRKMDKPSRELLMHTAATLSSEIEIDIQENIA